MDEQPAAAHQQLASHELDGLRHRPGLRAAWLDHVTGLAERDDRIAAAWVFGSEATDTADELSDIDLFIAFADASELDRVPDWLLRLGPLLHAHENPYNAPAHGRFFAAAYPGAPLSLIVDSYWQPAGQALLGNDTWVILDKVGLPHAEPARSTFAQLPTVRDSLPYVAWPDRAQRLDDAISAFWSDVPIVAKHRARRLPWADEELDALRTTAHNIAADLATPVRAKTAPRPGLRSLLENMDQLLTPEQTARHASARADAYQWTDVTDVLIALDDIRHDHPGRFR